MRNKLVKTVAAGVAVLGLGAILAQAAAPAAPQGVITAKIFLNIGGGTVPSDLLGNAKFPDSPDLVQYPKFFELYGGDDINTAPAGDVYNNSGAQMVGYFYPDTTGDYTFYISADDGANLYLSTDADPANKKLIAQEGGYSGNRGYTAIGGGASTVEAKCSLTFTGTQWPTKDPSGGAKITLTQGQVYYIEAIAKEGGGGDNLSVSIDSLLPIPGTMLSSFGKTTGPLSIVTQPQSQTVNALDPVTFKVVVDGTPPYTFQWQKNGADIAGATTDTLAIARTGAPDNGAKYKVVITGAQGGPLTSTEATLTVNSDTTAPTIASVVPSADFVSIAVTFSEPLDPATAAAAANYKLSGGITVSAATLGAVPNDNRVTLTTSQMATGSDLTLTVSNVKDLAGNTITANSTFAFKTAIFANGWATYQRWDNANGDPGDLAAFSAAIADGSIRAPDINTAVQQFGGPWGAADNYSSRVFGWFTPPSSGTYVFFLSSDDGSNLYLSTDDKPANKKLIANESGWSNQYQWFTVGGGSVLEDKRSDTFANSEWGGPIVLVGGQKYYIEILEDEGGGGDGSDATFIKEGEADPAQSAAGMFLKGNVIATYLDPNGATLDITTPPVDTTQQEQRAATFSVTATGSSPYGNNVTYQWQKAAPGSTTFTDIPGATAATYTTPVLTLADSGSKYQVVASVPTLSKASAAATLTVVPDTFAPIVVSAGSIAKGTAFEIGVGFDENVDAASAGTIANYTLSKGTITGIRYQKYAHTGGAPFFQLGTAGPFNGASVVLTTTGLAAGDSVTVTVKNIKDLKGNTMAAAGESKSFFVTSKMKWAAMGGDDYLQGETGGQNITADPALWVDDVIAYSDSDFDLVSSGTANWDPYDESTFVYEEVTGDFDKVVRVEYQDPVSQWSRAGMCATPSADEGLTRAQVTGGTQMEKRFFVRANPAVQWNGNAGNNQNEAVWRLTKASNYASAAGGTPAYPNAWLRMQRIGQTFTAFHSADGKTWTQYGSTTFTDEPMPDKLLVGPYYCPEFGNNGSGEGVGHSTVAKFRQYSSFVAKPSQVSYGVGLNFGADEPNAANGGIIPSVGTAGAQGVIQGNWNNLNGAAGTSSSIKADKLGAAQPTSMTVTWTSPNTWSSTGRGEENNQLPDNDKILMTGYLDTGGATTTTVDISAIPTDLTAEGYDVYIYALGGVAGRGGGYRVTKADGTTALTEYVDAQSPTNPTNQIQVVPKAGTWAAGTYIVFKNLTEASIQVQATTENGHGFSGTPRASLNAIQLVKSTGGVVGPGEMTISLSGGNITINWEGTGTLQSNTGLTGTWTDIGTTKPYTAPASGATTFYRVKGQ